jgi:hypothetical protein
VKRGAVNRGYSSAHPTTVIPGLVPVDERRASPLPARGERVRVRGSVCTPREGQHPHVACVPIQAFQRAPAGR